MHTKDSGCQIVSFVFMLLALTGYLAAFSSTYWMQDGDTHYGLWAACNGDICTSMIGTEITTIGFIFGQALFCIGLATCLVSVAGHIAWTILGLESTCVVAWAGTIATAFFGALAVILWGNESFRYFNDNVLAWSFWVMIASLCLMAFTGGVTACKTGCGTSIKRQRIVAYSSTAARGAAGTQGYPGGTHDLSDYSDMTQSDYSLPMPIQSKPGPGWSRGGYHGRRKF